MPPVTCVVMYMYIYIIYIIECTDLTMSWLAHPQFCCTMYNGLNYKKPLARRFFLNKIFNVFLTFYFQPGQIQASDGMQISPPASSVSFPNTDTNIAPLHKERCPSRKDAAVLTEALNDGTSTWIRGPRRRRRWQIYRVKEPYGSEDELNTDGEDEFDLKYRREKDRDTQEPEYKEEMPAHERRLNRCPFL